MAKILVLSLPRSGSSIITQLITSSGYKPFIGNKSHLLTSSEFNKGGYFEDALITLLNDQLIRMIYGSNYSFLHVPPFDSLSTSIPSSSFYYDLDHIFIPPGYKENPTQYSGCEWDVWGLTRMQPGKKWHKCYSAYQIETGEKIISTLNEIITTLNSYEGNLVVKDPRMALVAPLYSLQEFKVIYIKRNLQDTLQSMRRHYGVNLFTTNYLPNSEYCSNHFNYKIKTQSFDYYYKTYSSFIEKYIENKDHLIVDYDLLGDKSTIDSINSFIGAEINPNLYEKNYNK